MRLDADSALSGDSGTANDRSHAGINKQRTNRSKLATGNGEQRADSRDLGVQRSWLTRFLHIKPASRIMCFETGRGRVRTELVRLLRNWRSYGLRDIVLDREKNLIFGRLAAENCEFSTFCSGSFRRGDRIVAFEIRIGLT